VPTIDIVATDQSPEYLNTVALEIFNKWVSFARGRSSLGGRTLLHPTGRYAASISIRRYGTRHGVRSSGAIPTRTISHVAIIADEKLAPEAAILETGHRPIDMLQHLSPGRSYPIHRDSPLPGVAAGAEFPTTPYGRSRVRKMWTVQRELGARGFARTPGLGSPRGASNTSGTGRAWTIPAMPSYSPAQILTDLINNQYDLRATVR
jgi:hypothetical protein